MNKKSLLFLLLTALFAPWAAYAQQNSLTVYEDATETSYAIPMFVTWFDYFTRSQTVFPAEDLAEMAGGTITAIKFYTTNSNIPYTTVSAADIYLTEVEDATISSFIDKSLATVVCQGYFDFVAADGGGEVTLTFDTPYPYQGGNLLFGCDNIENNGYGIVYFYGKTATGASISGYNADAGGIINPTNCNFLPKTTFTYEPPVGESCQRPTSMAVSNIFSNSASVTWEGEGSIWNLRYKASYDANWTYVNGLTAMSYNLTDLYENTAYFVQVQNVCDNNSTSVWKAVSFRTLAISLTETFTTGVPPSGWARYRGLLSDVMNGAALTPNTTWSLGVWNFGNYDGVFDRHACLTISGSGCYYWLVSPTIAVENNVRLAFDLAVKHRTTGQNDNKVVVLVTTDGGTTWSILRQWDNQGSAYVYNSISTTGEAVYIDLSSYAGQSIRLAFYGESTVQDYYFSIPYSNTLHIDNVYVEHIPDCDRPMVFSVSTITGYNATLNWTSDADSWIVAYKTNADADFTEVPVTEHPYTLTDLVPGTVYSAKVRSVCGNLYSEWSNTVRFTTDVACPAPTNLSATNITHNAATIGWTSYNENFQLRYRKQSDTDWIMVDNLTSPYRLTGLEPDTYYTVEVRANCGDDGESLWATRDIKTYACSGYIAYVTNISPTSVRAKLNGYSESFTVKYREAAIEDAPFKEDFEDDACLNDWTFISMNAANNIGNPNGAGRFSTAAHWGNYGFRFSSENAIQSGETYDQYLISPQLNTTGELKFYINCFLGTDFYVGYSTTTNDLEAFTWTEYRISYSQTWQIHRQQLPDDVKYVAFHYYYIPSIANQKFYIDDITIGTYEIEPAGPWNYVTTEETTIILDNLTGGTEYEAIVVPSCDETHESMTVSFTTTTPVCGVGNVAVNDITHNSATASWTGNSESYTVRYRETPHERIVLMQDFEDADSFAEWTFISMNAANDIGTNLGAGRYSVAAHHGAYGFRFSSANQKYGSGSYEQYLISPELTGAGELKFDYKKNHNNQHEYLRVGYSTTTNSLGQFTWISSFYPNLEWETYTQQLPADVKYIAINLSTERGSFVFVDDISITNNDAGPWNYITTEETTASITNLARSTEYEVVVVPSCNETLESDPVLFTTDGCWVPTNVAASNITHTTATVSWTGNSESYTVQYRANYGINEEFRDPLLPGGWTRYTGTLNANGTASLSTTNAGWYFGSNYFNNIHAYTCIFVYNKYWLVSPSFTIDNGYTLSFDVAYTAYNSTAAPDPSGTDDRFLVLISTDEKAHWTILREYNNSGSPYVLNNIPKTFQTVNDIDISAYVGQTVYIAFYGASTEANSDNTLRIDNVMCGLAGEWQAITTTQPSVTINGLTPGTGYEVIVIPSCNETLESDVITFITSSDEQKLFVTDGGWHVADNWSPAGVPTIDQDIELRANVTINGIAEARTITQGNYTITIEDGGQLKHSEYGFNNGLTATVKKNITGYGEGNGNWYLIANPVTLDITPNQENGMLNGPYDLYEWNDTVSDDLEWRNYKVDGQAFSLLSGSTGYLYANQDGTELSFYGPIRSSHNNRIVLIDNHDGSNEFGSWFLLGNPFVCDAYLIDPNYNTLACYRMNAEGTGFEAVEGAIAPMEGVLYEAPSSGYVYFTRTPPTRSGALNMTVTQGTAMVDNVIIRFGEGNMLGKKSFREGSTMLYIPQDGKDYAVVNAGPSGEIPVNFKAEKNGTYTLHFNAEEVGFSYLHLVDNLTGADVDLMAPEPVEGPVSYTFEAKTTDYASRFKLVFSNGGDAEGCH